ncbi:hypothetical protein W02_29290 [Nitrospira sp. KM1]|uniref:hypothetical protein n=1 Tax=Nitrospira sp. KM1 TaxID=1936990 RepID=UPI0013A74299|nr:hypothetical protein [Nitrospira sp. KM1]BCA55789.1 hypothetical protein W02_29290 [Nitrospira sp. KM1]
MTSKSVTHPAQHHPAWHHPFAFAVRYVLAPLILSFSGFFSANFFISGHYTWPRTSRMLALTLTLLVLSYEFVYKEQRARSGSPEQARAAVLYACIIPYLAGVALMLALWKL